MSEKNKEWWENILKNIENYRNYGKILSTTLPTNNNNNNIFRIEYKLYPSIDLIIDEPIIIEFAIESSFPTNLPIIYIHDKTQFERYNIPINDNILTLSWMEKTKFPLSVWLFSIRGLFLNSNYSPWNTPLTIQSNLSNSDHISLPSLIGGTGRIRGRRMYMEDVDFTHTISIGRTVTIYGVLDGHGGQECARYAAEEIPTQIISLIRSGKDYPECLYYSYMNTDEHFIKTNSSGIKAGSTATVLLYDHNQGLVCVGNSGDTRAVLSRLRTAIDLTRDMKASDPLEISRILRAGGQVINGRVLGSLAVARSLGDCQLKAINDRAVIANPEITSFYFQQDDEFIVLATDGLWDVMSSQTVVDMIWTSITEQNLLPFTEQIDENYISNTLGKISESLANHACNNLNSADNITVTIILLRHTSPPTSLSSSRRDTNQVNSSITSTSSSSSTQSMNSSSNRTLPKTSSFNQKNNYYEQTISNVVSNNNNNNGNNNNNNNNNYNSNNKEDQNILTEKRKNETDVNDDDLMRFLLDDSNF